VSLGYLNDEYAQHFTTNSIRRMPIINRGTYVRTSAIDNLVYAFLQKNDGRRTQIVSLGAGTDTRYFRLREDARHNLLTYHEIDFQEITANKISIIARKADLSPLEDPNMNHIEPNPNGSFYSPTYNIHGFDLRNGLPDVVPNLRNDCPTLLISECCLCYLLPQQASNIIDYFSRRIRTIGIVIYEPTNPRTTFGQMMKANLSARNLYMPTLEAWGSLQEQRDRLTCAGFRDEQHAADIGWLWDKWVHPSEKERLDKIETLDEVEEWELLAGHYLITWGFRDPGRTGAFDDWQRLCPGPGSRPGY